MMNAPLEAAALPFLLGCCAADGEEDVLVAGLFPRTEERVGSSGNAAPDGAEVRPRV